MNLQQIARKLRAAADVLDELLGVDRAVTTSNETSDTAHLIRQTLRKKIIYKKGTHWTQRPENRARVKRFTKRAAAAATKHKRTNSLKGKKFKPGTHWTHTAAGKRKMALAQRKAWQKRHHESLEQHEQAVAS